MANGSRHSMRYVPEVTYGVTPANPAFRPIRHLGTTLGMSKESLQSGELRSDRQIADFRMGARQTGGDISIELSFGSFDDLLEAVLCGTWAPAKTTGSVQLSVTVAGSTYKFVRTAGSFLTDGFDVGTTLIASGFTNANNNGRFFVLAATATELTVQPTQLQMPVAEAAGARVLNSLRATLKAGVLRRSFTVEREFGDMEAAAKPYHRFTGVEMNTLALTIAANAMVTGTIGTVGKGFSTDSALLAGATYAEPTTTEPVDSFTGTLNESGNPISVITEIGLNLTNGLETRFVVGSKDTIRPSIARSNVTGTVTAYFEDSSLLDKFVNEHDSNMTFETPDVDGNRYRFTIPRFKYTGGQPDVSGEGPITLSMPYQALLDPVTKTNLMIERIPA